MRKLWNIAFKPSGSRIKPEQLVCDKHFHPDEILWQRTLVGPDGTVFGIVSFRIFIFHTIRPFVSVLFTLLYFLIFLQSPYSVPRLKKGTVPSIFSWTTEVTRPPADALPNDIANSEDIETQSIHFASSEDFAMQPMQSENSKVIEMNISNIPNVSEDRTPLMDTAHEVIQPEIFDIPSQFRC